MKTMPLLAPQLGESVREILVVRKLVPVGQAILVDQLLLEVETHKASYSIEAPTSGKIQRWLVEDGETVAVGTMLAIIETDVVGSGEGECGFDSSNHVGRPENSGELDYRPSLTNRHISPYARAALGKTSNQLKGTERLLAGLPARPLLANQVHMDSQAKSGETQGAVPISRSNIFSLSRFPFDEAIPAFVQIEMEWSRLSNFRKKLRGQGVEVPSHLEIFSWLVARTSNNHLPIRSRVLENRSVAVMDSFHLGIAVSLPNDGLTTAVVEGANRVSWAKWSRVVRDAIHVARSQAGVRLIPHLTISNMIPYRVTGAIPTVVYPSVGTIVLTRSAKLEAGGDRTSQLTDVVTVGLAFDHRVINGVGAARFLRAVSAFQEDDDW